jgi:segregation and condensation protein B
VTEPLNPEVETDASPQSDPRPEPETSYGEVTGNSEAPDLVARSSDPFVDPAADALDLAAADAAAPRALATSHVDPIAQDDLQPPSQLSSDPRVEGTAIDGDAGRTSGEDLSASVNPVAEDPVAEDPEARDELAAVAGDGGVDRVAPESARVEPSIEDGIAERVSDEDDAASPEAPTASGPVELAADDGEPPTAGVRSRGWGADERELAERIGSLVSSLSAGPAGDGSPAPARTDERPAGSGTAAGPEPEAAADRTPAGPDSETEALSAAVNRVPASFVPATDALRNDIDGADLPSAGSDADPARDADPVGDGGAASDTGYASDARDADVAGDGGLAGDRDPRDGGLAGDRDPRDGGLAGDRDPRDGGLAGRGEPMADGAAEVVGGDGSPTGAVSVVAGVPGASGGAPGAVAGVPDEGAGASAGEGGPVQEELDELADPDRLRSAVEAVLLVVDTPTSALTLAQVLGRSVPEVTAALRSLRDEYDAGVRGMDLREVADGWRLYSRDDFAGYVERFILDGQQARLTQASLETLAVIAYRQPVTRSRISGIRGVSVDAVMRTLLTRGLVEECGADPDTGGGLYRTTRLFLEKMGLRSLDELPSLAPLLPDTSQLDDVELST